MKLGARVLLGIPTTRGARRSVNWIEAMASLQMALGSSMGRVWIEDETIAQARNAICDKALELGCQYLFFLSDDVLPPPNVLLLMLDKIGRSFPVGGGQVARASMITGVYWTKSYPLEPYLWNGLLQGSYRDWKAGEFFPVDLAGCDCLMVETAMLRELPRPWFSTDWAWEPGQQPSPIATEDYYFFTKARRQNYRLFADTSIQCGHEDRDTGAIYGIAEDMPQAGGMPFTADTEELLVAEVGAGLACPTYGARTRVTRFDLRPEVKPDVRCDVRHLPADYYGKFDLVHASHVLEHFGRAEAPDLLQEWTRLLKPGGKLIVRVPNMEVAFRHILEGQVTNYDWAMVYGDQKDGIAGYHHNGFTTRKLAALLAMHGRLQDITVDHDPRPDCGHNLVATATLARPAQAEAIGTWWEEIRQREKVAAGPTAELAPPDVDS